MLFVLVNVESLYFPETEFAFASYYSSHMVLQRASSRAIIWGYATEVGIEVNLSISGEQYSTNAVPGKDNEHISIIN